MSNQPYLPVDVYKPVDIEELREKYSLKNIMTEDEYEAAKKRYIQSNTVPAANIPDVVLGKGQFYKNNPYLRRENITIPFTQEMIDEYVKCLDDPIYFIEAYGKIVHVDFGLVPFNLRPFQKDVVKVCSEFQRVILNTSRQVGKCVIGNTHIEVIQLNSMGIFKKWFIKLLIKLAKL